jgi:hypothetical protein
MLTLKLECFRLNHIFDYKDYSYLGEAFTKDEINKMIMDKYLNRNDQWKKNIKNLISKIDSIIKIIEKILKYEDFIDEELMFNFEFAIIKFSEICTESLYYSKKKDFSEFASENITSALDVIDKLIGKYGS